MPGCQGNDGAGHILLVRTRADMKKQHIARRDGITRMLIKDITADAKGSHYLINIANVGTADTLKNTGVHSKQIPKLVLPHSNIHHAIQDPSILQKPFDLQGTRRTKQDDLLLLIHEARHDDSRGTGYICATSILQHCLLTLSWHCAGQKLLTCCLSNALGAGTLSAWASVCASRWTCTTSIVLRHLQSVAFCFFSSI